MWTVLVHDGPAAVTVQGSSLHKPYVLKFNYSASAEQLRAVVSGSEQCQQEVVYNCRKSRLFNTKGTVFHSNANTKLQVQLRLKHIDRRFMRIEADLC